MSRSVEVPKRPEEPAEPASADAEPFPAQVDEAKREGEADDFAPAVPTELEKASDAPTDTRERGNLGGRFDGAAGSSSAKKKKRKKTSKSKGDAPAKPKPAARPGSKAPSAEPPPREEAERAVADPQRLIANLDSLERQLRSAGLRLPQDAGGDKSFEDQEGSFDCEKVCEIQGAICALEDRICSLAKAHPEDDRYANACRRAKGDCNVAKSACSTCD